MTGRYGEKNLGQTEGSSLPGLLARALHADDDETRLAAARALREQPTDLAIPDLITALRDPNAGVRWLAGEALIRIGAPAVPPLLHALVLQAPNEWFYEEAEHILRHLQLAEFQGRLGPVVAALGHSTRDVEAPVQAELAYQALSGLAT